MANEDYDDAGLEAWGRIFEFAVWLNAVFLLTLLRGWALSCMWAWFLTPHLWIPSPGVYHCGGLYLMARIMVNTQQDTRAAKTEEEKKLELGRWASLCWAVALTLIPLSFAWLLK